GGGPSNPRPDLPRPRPARSWRPMGTKRRRPHHLLTTTPPTRCRTTVTERLGMPTHRMIRFAPAAGRWIAACLLLLVAVSLAVPTRAERQLVDRVVAIVDDDAILLSEVLQEMNLVRMQRKLGTLSEEDQEKLF